ncbi:hypothetical protein N799_08605 [Lysobacter arseniciresistens ZS79]|uniref:Uncharacterized protein n=1 Tax=Lysobacter arseniciresistens ZS79 TaxID=913325 RepID=A0A0A0EXI9_9GAMM|nr:hypothetical protein N799_08605 [Lysobacter arseniciresistens ZS79]
MNQGDREQFDAVRDQEFREKMKQSDDPKDQEWVKLDEEAQKKEAQIGEYETTIDKRKNMGSDIYEMEQQLTEAQDSRDAHIASGRPSIFQKEDRQAWDMAKAKYEGEVGSYQKSLLEMARKSSPERIGELQGRMEAKQGELEELVAERQGIAKLPSESNSLTMTDRIEQSRESWSPSYDEAKRQSGNGQGLVQEARSHQSDGTEAGTRLQPNYAKAAETQEDRDFVKQLEADQLAAHQQLGHVPSDAEMQTFIAQRQAQEATAAKQGGVQAENQHEDANFEHAKATAQKVSNEANQPKGTTFEDKTEKNEQTQNQFHQQVQQRRNAQSQ